VFFSFLKLILIDLMQIGVLYTFLQNPIAPFVNIKRGKIRRGGLVRVEMV
jgi:hypothetical protein